MTVQQSTYVGTVDATDRGRKIPGEPEFWIFVLGDMALFAVFFILWGWNNAHQPELFDANRATLSKGIGLTNTLLLITSSALVAAGLTRARDGHVQVARRLYQGAMTLGGGFLVLKVVEYEAHIRHGMSAVSNDFFMLYFVFTGIHALHVVAGLAALALGARQCTARADPERAGTPGPNLVLLESVGVYWHMVDVFWLFLFAIIYLV